MLGVWGLVWYGWRSQPTLPSAPSVKKPTTNPGRSEPIARRTRPPSVRPSTRPKTPRVAPPKVTSPPRTPSQPKPIKELDLPLLFAQINGFVRSFRFELALENLRTVHAVAGRSADRERVARRIEWVEGYLQLLDKLIVAIRSGPLRGHRLRIEGLRQLAVTLVDASRGGFRAALADKGFVGELWGNMPYRQRWGLIAQMPWSGAEWLRIARLSRDLDDAKLAEKSLVRAWGASKSVRPEVGRLLSSYRGKPTPDGGWVLYRGALVTPEVREKRTRGLVLFEGRWVTRKERYHLVRHHVRQGDRWIPRTPEQLIRAGYKQVNGRWMSRQQRASQTRDFKHPWRHRTENWLVETNISQQFARLAGAALESAYVAQKAFFGKEPRGRKRLTMKIWKGYEDYRGYCKKIGNMSNLNASGFAPSEPRTAVAYDKYKSRTSLMRTVIHESTHLFYGVAIRRSAPSWMAEGMATYFEGFRLSSSGQLTFDHKPANRLRLLKSALESNQTFPLEQFSMLRVHDLLNTNSTRALVFYAQAWGYFYFFNKTENPRYRAAFQKYWKGLKRGAVPKLKKLLGGDYAPVERDFRRFMRKQ